MSIPIFSELSSLLLEVDDDTTISEIFGDLGSDLLLYDSEEGFATLQLEISDLLSHYSS